MYLYRGALDYGSFLIIVVFSLKSCSSRLIFFMSLLRCAVNTLFSLEKLCENGLFSVLLVGPATVVSVAYVTRGTGGLT
jgi:hypothetical protein